MGIGIRSRQDKNRVVDCRGFTLVEILIAIGISGFVLAGLYTSFLGQQRSYFVNERLAEMQQNLRGAMMQMSREIRMAGYDPSGDAGAAILYAGAGRIRFEQDRDASGNIEQNDETVVYGFRNADSNPDFDGIPGTVTEVASLRRAIGTDPPLQFNSIAEHIAAIGFAYGFSQGGTTIWAIDTDEPPNGNGFLDTQLIFNGNTVDTQLLATPVPYDRITAVRIWILARASREARSHFDSGPYVVGMNVVTPENRYYHRLLVTTIQLRNM
jgi:type IV pilus assembly protein PilW